METYIYGIWFIIILSSLIIAKTHLARNQFQTSWIVLKTIMGTIVSTLWIAFSSIIGAIMSWGLVSVYIGIYKIDGYMGSITFIISLIIGTIGIILFTLSCIALKRSYEKI
ncbi:MAG: hypothetical protein KAH84_02135 [Thiomargarita sp.]|nr:hypothetical protein [Thiomargarita sp.]